MVHTIGLRGSHDKTNQPCIPFLSSRLNLTLSSHYNCSHGVVSEHSWLSLLVTKYIIIQYISQHPPCSSFFLFSIISFMPTASPLPLPLPTFVPSPPEPPSPFPCTLSLSPSSNSMLSSRSSKTASILVASLAEVSLKGMASFCAKSLCAYSKQCPPGLLPACALPGRSCCR